MMSLQKRFSDSLLGIIDVGPDDGEGTWKIEETADVESFRDHRLNMLLTTIDVLFPLVG
jgi:5-enolpyruvylshikimate-3-phosphate synthase